MKRTALKVAALAISALASIATAQANIITGSLWEGVSGDAIPANVPGTTPDVTFSVNSPINFDSRGILGDATFYTIGSWLATGGATILTGASHAGDTLDNTLIQFTGMVSVTTGQTFTATHDDGLTLIIGGLPVISAGGPTAPTVTTVTYTGPSGNLPFQLVYGEVMGPPAVLQLDLPLTAVPEPSTFLAGALLAIPVGLQGLRKLRNRKQAA